MKGTSSIFCFGMILFATSVFTSLPANAADYTQAQRQEAWTSIENQRKDIQTRVNSAQTGGQISAAQAADLSSQLQQTAQAQAASVNDGIFSNSDFSSLSNSLNNINLQVKRAIENGGGRFNSNLPGTSVTVPPTDTNFNQIQAQASWTAIENQRKDIQARISSAQVGGQITAAQAADLNAQLQQTIQAQAASVNDGVFSKSDARDISNSLENISIAVKRTIERSAGRFNNFTGTPAASPWGNNPQYSSTCNRLDGIQTSISALIEQGRANGSLRGGLYGDLKNELDSIIYRRQQINASGNGMGQLNNLSRRLDKLQAKVQNYISTYRPRDHGHHDHDYRDNDHSDRDHDHNN